MLALVACHSQATDGAPAQTAAPAPAAAPSQAAEPAARAPSSNPALQDGPAEPHKFERTAQMMGTIIRVVVVGVDDAQAQPVVDSALDEMRRLESVLSEWQPDSEISRINAAAGERAIKVGPDTLANVVVSNRVSAWSDGAFDLSWAALHDLYTFKPGSERIPTRAELDERLPLINWHDIVVDEKAQTVFLKRKGMRLGTGGIAKGYALDRAAEILQKGGLENYMIFGGGQVLVHGKKGDRLWRVGIQHPRMDDYFAFIELTNASISTSGDYEHSFFKDGKRWHHIIDLKTGLPVEHTTSVTVISPSGFYGDAVDTAMFIMGADKTLARLKDAPGPPLEVVMVDKDMRVHMSPGIQDKIIWHMSLSDGKLPLPPAQ